MNTEDKIKVMQQALIDGVVLSKNKKLINPTFYESKVDSVSWNWYNYSFKNIKKPEYIPFTMDDADLFIGKAMFHKDNVNTIFTVSYCNKDKVNVGGVAMTYKEALEKLSLLKTPFGKLKK